MWDLKEVEGGTDLYADSQCGESVSYICNGPVFRSYHRAISNILCYCHATKLTLDYSSRKRAELEEIPTLSL